MYTYRLYCVIFVRFLLLRLIQFALHNMYINCKIIKLIRRRSTGCLARGLLIQNVVWSNLNSITTSSFIIVNLLETSGCSVRILCV